MHVFIDESGTLPDVKDAVIVVAAVGVTNPERIDTLIKQVKKKGKFRKQTGELKFYTAGNQTRKLFLEKIVHENFDMCVLIVEKKGKRILDTPENFALLCWFLLSDVLSVVQDVRHVVFDRHFSSEEDIHTFNTLVTQYVQKELVLEHVDSKKDKRVNVADMVAGAVLAYEAGKSSEFYEIIARKIISLKRIKWREIRQKLFEKQKLA